MKAAVIYWSSTGNTQAMAEFIAAGMQSAGAEVSVMTVDEAQSASLSDYNKIAFGCPAMGSEVLEESEFEPYFASIEGELKGKSVALFGSYGWGDGEWMRSWQERVADDGASLFEEGLIYCGEGDADECTAFGSRFAS